MRWLLLSLFGGLAACTPDPTTPSPPPPAASGYSPFGVHAHTRRAQTISFKDVGLRLPEAQRTVVLEAIAEAVATRLEGHAEHHPDWATEGWHGQCRSEHLYVDLWRSPGPDRLGFSLWQGCSADDQLMSHELPTVPAAFEGPDWIEHASKLGEAVGEAVGRCGAGAC